MSFLYGDWMGVLKVEFDELTSIEVDKTTIAGRSVVLSEVELEWGEIEVRQLRWRQII
jgi:hypothetical protein